MHRPCGQLYGAAWKRHVTPLLRTLPHPVLCNGAEKDRCRMEPGAAHCSGADLAN